MRAEKPHIGRSGVPFMKRMTSCSEIASWMASRMGFSDMCSLRSGLEGKGVDGAADVGPEHRVDAAVLLDAAQARELGATTVARKWSPPPVRSWTSAVAAGDRGLDALLELVGGGHRRQPSGRYTS